MIILFIWIIPIIILFYVKWNTLPKNACIKDLVNRVTPCCRKCVRKCPGFDWVVFIPFVGVIWILYIILYDPFIKFINIKIK